MSYSNYPNGFSNGLTVRGLPIQIAQPGQVFWVNGSSVLADDGVLGSDGNRGTYQKPFATIDYAIGQCTANRGDVIMVMPGHTETISAAGSIAADVAGVAIVGLGSGSKRPTLSFTAAAASITVSAANVTFKNILFSAAFADVAEVFTPSAKNLALEDCEFVDSAADLNFLSIADTGTTDNECDGLSLVRCKWVTVDTAALTALSIDADLDGLVVEDCYMNVGVNTNDLPIVAIVATGKDLTNLSIKGNNFIRLNDANPLILTADTTTANTGVIQDNTVRHLDVAAELLVTAGTNISFSNNLCSAAVDKSGYLIPAADS